MTAARHVVVSIGFFDLPNPLAVPGEHLPKVTHYYREPYPYVRQKVAVVGARNSAAKAALDCHRHGAAVTLIVRSAVLSEKIRVLDQAGSREQDCRGQHPRILQLGDRRDS